MRPEGLNGTYRMHQKHGETCSSPITTVRFRVSASSNVRTSSFKRKTNMK